MKNRPSQNIYHTLGEFINYKVEKPKYVPRLQKALQTEKSVRVIAFYLPQFHTIPENDKWWGKGFTEWTNVKSALPQFSGHYQPHIPDDYLGYYNLLDRNAQAKQVELAKQYGVDGFCFYLYWFSGKRLLEQPVDNYLNDPSLDLPYCICWANENWSRRWDGLDHDLLMTQTYSPQDDIEFISTIAKYLRDPRYIRIEGKPLLLVYRPTLFPDMKMTALRWRTWCRKNDIGEIYLAYTQSFERVDPAIYGFDAAVEFPPNNSSPPNITDLVKPAVSDFHSTVYDWRVFIERSEKYQNPGYKLFRGVCPSWDNTARRKNMGTVFRNSCPKRFTQWLANAFTDTLKRFENQDERIVFINAWNEWAEGAHLEPDQRYGYAWLQAVRDAHQAIATRLHGGSSQSRSDGNNPKGGCANPDVRSATVISPSSMKKSWKYLWESLDFEATDPEVVPLYYSNPRVNLLRLLKNPPRRMLDIGCAAGAAGAWLKERYPQIELWGIEANASMARLAAKHYHRVFPGKIEEVDLVEQGLEQHSVDLLVLADVLEHMSNPWRVLERLQPFVAFDAQVIVSLPNARNLWLINEISEGRFTYEPSGILDITHLRFFTREEGMRMLEQTGYSVDAIAYEPDSRFFDAQRPKTFPANIETERLVFKNIDEDTYQQLISLQIFYRATPIKSAEIQPIADLTASQQGSAQGESTQSEGGPHLLYAGAPQGSGSAVLLHLYYPDLWPEFRDAIAQIPAPCDLYISLTKGREGVLADIVRDRPDAVVIQHPNRGRDIAPRLALLRRARTQCYDQLLHLHSKKSPHLREVEHIQIPFLQHRDGGLWRRELISELLYDAKEAIATFSKNPGLGLLGPRRFWLQTGFSDRNIPRLAQLSAKMGLTLDPLRHGYFAGSMFWCRPQALDPLLALNLELKDFDEESGQTDGTLAHVVERLFTLSAEQAGFQIGDMTGSLLATPKQPALPWLPEARWQPLEKAWAKELMESWQKDGQISPRFALALLADGRHPSQGTQESMAGQWLSGELLSLADGAGEDGELFNVLNHHIRDMAADWVGIVDAGDQLAPDALFRVAHALREHPEWQLVYTDEDSLTPDGQHFNPHCKPDFNIDYLRSLPYIGGLLLIKKELFAELGGFDPAADGAEDYDLILRAWEKIGDAGIGHIPEVLYHRLQGGGHCSKSVEDIIQVSQTVLQQHLQRLGIAAEVTPGPFPPSTRVRYPLHEKPLVSILIPTRNQLGYLQRCVESLIEKTQYPAYEILIIDNDSDDAEARTYLDMLAAQEEQLGGRLRVLRHPGPFNFSAMNNRAVEQARGDYLLLLNNDTAALHEDWLDEMMSHALRPEVGVVGAKLLFPDGKIQHAGVILGMRGPAEHPFIGQPPEYRGYFGRAMLTQNLSAVTGACLLISKALYQELGGLDEQRFQVSYNDIDLCLKAREAGHKIVFTPWAMLLHEGSASQRGEVEKKPSAEKEQRFAGEKMAFYQKWLPQLAFDPAYNRHLSLASTDFLLEDQAALTWDPEWRPRPRILVHPADREGCGEYRIISPMRALQKAGRAQGWETMRIFEPAEMARFSPESIVLQRQMEWPQIEALERHKKLLKTFRVFEIDDLITNLPVKSLHKAQIHKDIAKRFRKAAGLCNRLVVATEPLAKAYQGFSEEVRVQPNCIEDAIWGVLQPKRRGGSKPRVGWAGGVGHTGDLEMIADVVRDLADEVDWVFFGLCPDALRPYVREFHTGVPLPQYPAKLASLDLDLALAPLENNAFNEAKSHLRILEYGILGYPVIASDIFPYQGDFPVTLVANRYRDWVRAIREQIADRQALAAAGDRLREHVRAHWLLEEHLDDWLAAWLP